MRDALATIKLIHPFLDSRKKFNPLGDFIERNFVGQLANGIQSNLFLRHVANISGHQTQSKPGYRGRRSGLFVAFVIFCKNTNRGEEVFLNASCVGGFVFASSLSSSASARPQCSQLDGGRVYNRIRTGFADSIRGAAWRPVAKYSREFWTRQKMSADLGRTSSGENGQPPDGRPLHEKSFLGDKTTPVFSVVPGIDSRSFASVISTYAIIIQLSAHDPS